jgi:hypothetical protein
MIIQTVTVGDYKANLLQLKCGNHIGYQYRIYTKINGKRTCVARNYSYMWDKDACYQKMVDDLNVTMGIVKYLFH